MTTLVSVVVPAWNVAGLLPRCLDSLLAQTHRPLEIIVVDDGSTDGSGDVMHRYHELHPEVQVVSQQHHGLGPARNAALSIAHGEFVCLVDADDWVEPDFIADLLHIATSTGADVVVCGFWFHQWGLRAPFPFLPRATHFSGVQAARLSLNPVRMPGFAWNRLYRRSLFHPGDPPFPSILYEDIATTTRILARADSVALTRRAYYHYCLRPDSITGQFGVKNVFSVAAALDILRRYLHAEGLWDAWSPAFRGMLRQLFVLISVQVVFQRNRIPLPARGPLVLRYARRLRSLAEPPTDGHQLRPVRLHSSRPRTTLPREPVSGTVTVARPPLSDTDRVRERRGDAPGDGY